MPVIVLEARDFTSTIFLVRTWEILSSCTTFSLVASLTPSELSKESSSTFKIFCMFTWCFFFTFTLLIQILSLIQFHSLIPISWKKLTVTMAVSGALMSLSAFVFFPWLQMDIQKVSPRPMAAAVASFLTFFAYTSESCILCRQDQEQRGYMGSIPGLLKIVQLWGGCQMIPLIVEMNCGPPSQENAWHLWVSSISYVVCALMALVTLVVILGDFAGRCLLPFDRFLACFSLIGVLFYMVATVICFTRILQWRTIEENSSSSRNCPELIIFETVVASITLLSYTVDLAFSIKLLCDRGHV